MRKYFWQIETNHEMLDVAKAIKEANKNLADSIAEASKNDVKARDRVDITLEEYERLKEENKQLRLENRQLYYLLSALRIPSNVLKRVKMDTVKTSVCHDVKDFVDTFRIEFDVDAPCVYGEGYEY